MKVEYKDIRLKRLPSDKQTQVNNRLAAMQTLKRLAMGCHMYAQDNDGTLPANLKALKPYVSDSFDAAAYVLVASGKVSEIQQASRAVLIRQKAPLSDGKQAVAFVDGHVEIVAK